MRSLRCSQRNVQAAGGSGCTRYLRTQNRRASPTLQASQGDGPSTSGRGQGTEITGAGLKAVWYAAEAFGKAVGGNRADRESIVTSAAQKLSLEEVVAEIRRDYDDNYFISGKGEMAAYAPDCRFADPFVAFRGTARFKQNVSNLGAMMQNVKLDIYDFKVNESDNTVKTRWRFSCLLPTLPWRPLLAAAGSTTHVYDPATGRVVEHIEEWDTEPGKVIRLLLRPAAKVPTRAWEVFMMAASEGDVSGMWLSASPLVLRATLPIVGISLLCKAITGEGLPGVALGAVEGVSYLLAVGALGTEAYKLVKGDIGG